MPKIHFESPRVKNGRLRVFADAEEAQDYEWAPPQSNKISVIILPGHVPWLRWHLFRCISPAREQRLREYLDRAGTAFALRDHGGGAYSFEQTPMKVVASTVCGIVGCWP